MATLMGLLVGVTQRILGSPGDLPEVVHQIHTSGRIAISQAPSMFVCSAFSIAAGRAPRYTRRSAVLLKARDATCHQSLEVYRSPSHCRDPMEEVPSQEGIAGKLPWNIGCNAQ
jgi:hypothetical protein